MTNFGNKFESSVKRLGVKTGKGARQLGNKIVSEMGKNSTTFRKIDNTMGEVSQIASFIPGGKVVAISAIGAHMANKVAKRSNKNQIEKYNSRKAIENKASNNESLNPRFFNLK